MSPSSYDLLPYEDYCFAATHPEHLYTVARLLGHEAPDFARCRVLELGCARGGNLVPMAFDLPGSEFVGIDISTRQIDEGAARITRLGLRNIELRAMSILDVDASLGTFDYVICHGVYSWVPEAVRTGIFAVCRDRLSPKGVAYVSYNTLPGWSVARSLRDFLLFHAGRFQAPARKLAAARDALGLLAHALAAQQTPYAACLRAEIAALEHADDSYLFHEYLEEVNEPVYFTDFVRNARSAGLEYLSDAELTNVLEGNAAAALLPGGRAADPIALEQYVDFIRNRRFRASLLVRSAQPPRRALEPEHIAAFYVSTRVELAEDSSESALRNEGPLTFALGEARFELRDPIAKCAMVTLVEAQRRPMSYGALCERTAARAGISDAAALRARLARHMDLLGMVFAGLVQLHASEARYAAEAGLRPLALPWAREQAMRGTAITTARHEQIDLPPFERTLLALLDGTRDRKALLGELERARREGRLPLDSSVQDAPGALARRCEEALEQLALNALLVA